MYKILVISATTLMLATPVLAEPPGNEHYDNGGPHVGSNNGTPSQMSDRDFFDALREGGDDNMGLSHGGKHGSGGSAGKGSFGGSGGDND